MKVRLGFLGLALVLASCSSDPEPVVAPTEVAETSTVVVTPTVTEPTPEPVVVADDQLVAAALAQLEVDVAAGDIPDVIAFDVLGQKVVDGDVTFTICAWAGDTAFDTVRDSLYRTTVDDTGAVSAQHVTTPLTTGDCLNTELIDSAFDFIDEYDVVRAEWSRDPASFTGDERVAEFLHPATTERLGQTLQGFVDDDVYYEPPFIGLDARASLVATPLYRRYTLEGESIVDLALCRQVNPLLGKYRAGVLIDDEQPDGDVGPHAVKVYELVRSSQSEGWRLAGAHVRGWANCGISDLPGAIGGWVGGEVPFQELTE